VICKNSPSPGAPETLTLPVTASSGITTSMSVPSADTASALTRTKPRAPCWSTRANSTSVNGPTGVPHWFFIILSWSESTGRPASKPPPSRIRWSLAIRQTLLCHEDREPNRDIDINRLQELYFSGFLRINDDVNLHDLTTQRFSSSLGDRFDISHPLTKAALVELGLTYPNTYSFPELLNRASTLVQEYGDAVHITDRDALLSELFNLYLSNGIHLSTVAREFPDGHAYKPKATALALLYATQNKGCVASVHHHSIGLNVFNRQLLQWCNGENTFADISELLNQRLHGDSDFHNSLETLFQNNDLDEKHLASQIEQELSHLGQHGLLQS